MINFDIEIRLLLGVPLRKDHQTCLDFVFRASPVGRKKIQGEMHQELELLSPRKWPRLRASNIFVSADSF